MKEQIIEYVRTQLSRNRARLRPYVFPNPEKEWKYPSRYAYIKIKKYISDILLEKEANQKKMGHHSWNEWDR